MEMTQFNTVYCTVLVELHTTCPRKILTGEIFVSNTAVFIINKKQVSTCNLDKYFFSSNGYFILQFTRGQILIEM